MRRGAKIAIQKVSSSAYNRRRLGGLDRQPVGLDRRAGACLVGLLVLALDLYVRVSKQTLVCEGKSGQVTYSVLLGNGHRGLNCCGFDRCGGGVEMKENVSAEKKRRARD